MPSEVPQWWPSVGGDHQVKLSIESSHQFGVNAGALLNTFLGESQRPVSSQRVRLWLWIFGCWFATAVILWLAWPYQPRLKIDGTGCDVVGITADSQELIAFARRKSTGEASDRLVSPGSIHIWKLKSGHHRAIPVPSRTWRDDSAVSDFKTWTLWSDQWSMKGQWFEFGIEDRSRPISNASRNAILNLSDDSIRFSDSGDHVLVSPTGRWFQRWNRSRTPVFAICETATGQERLLIQEFAGKDMGRGFSDPSPGCFLADDLYFACALDGPEGRSTRVWNMETGKTVISIDKHVHAIEFSRSHRLMAGLMQEDAPTANTSVVEAIIWDVESGNIVHRRQLSASPDIFARSRKPALKFTENDTGLVCYDLSNDAWFNSLHQGRSQDHVEIRLHFTWDFASNAKLIEVHDDPMFDPNFSDTYDIQDVLPKLIASRDKISSRVQLHEVTSRRPVLTMPPGAEPILLNREGTTLVCEQRRASRIARLMEWIGGRGITIPLFVWSRVPRDSIWWSVIDVPSGRTVASIPEQPNTYWLSPDEKTWVIASGTRPDINIWDFPPRKPFLGPIVWSLAAPVIILLGCGFRRVKSRFEKARMQS
jgi:hypothetical protein